MTTLLAICLSLATTTTAETGDRPCVLIVVGAPGSSEYESRFHQWASQWQAATEKADAEAIAIGLGRESGTTDHDRLQSILAEKAKAGTSREPLWIVLIGHGTFDGREAKFNLRGPDVTDLELFEWLKPLQRPVAFINCASASGPFLNRLSGPDRVIITATRSGNEQNYARFGQYLAEAIANPSADLDKDGQVSLLEAYLTAGGRVEESYRAQSQLATEHALLDDNGDKLGTPADWFRGVRATRRAKDGAPLDGIRANQFVLIPSDRERKLPAEIRQKRDQLERSIAALRDEKAKLAADTYYERLEPLMTELAKLYRAMPTATTERKP
ncbi:hypothetical protein [Singulisphaera acidiphila]|uniref:Caspase domain-containing protein n=1 Tax=Singulisphaera acidiphila (strain ATCC BAA-1392 / DSM 18658 / VKM B-2454 / MOB10) TaxID=886293 RepID=L0D607_SINAD|nr:hypothetical protein [Singulisphaera acidiphila]AGA24839.1 hypothetical protein Sinac_0400 [Singulisphaera acidiphila DSM 18658]